MRLEAEDLKGFNMALKEKTMRDKVFGEANSACYKFLKDLHRVKCVQIWSFFWSVFSRIRIEYGEIQSISIFGHISRSFLTI